MREIASVLGLLDKPIEVDVPKDLVCGIRVADPVTSILIHSL